MLELQTVAMASMFQTTIVSQPYHHQSSTSLLLVQSQLKFQGSSHGSINRGFNYKLQAATVSESLGFPLKTQFKTVRENVVKAQVSTIVNDSVAPTLTLPKRFVHLAELANELSAGGNVSSTLEQWMGRLTVHDCSFLCAELGSKDWQRSWEIFNFLRENGGLSFGKSTDEELVELETTATETPLTTSGDSTHSDLKQDKESSLDKPGPILKLYITLVRVLVKNHRFEELEQLRVHMKDTNVVPDAGFYNGMLDCCLDAGLMAKVSEVLLEMDASGLKPQQFLYEKVAYAYMKEEPSNLDKCKTIVKDLMDRGLAVNIGIFNNLIKAYWRVKDAVGVEEIFEVMQAAGHTPDLKVIVKVAQLRGRQGKHEAIVELMEKMSKWGIQPNSGIYDCLLLAYCRAGLMDKAKETFLLYKQVLNIKPTIIAFNMLIDGYGKQGLDEEALKVFEEMRQHGYRPNAVTYSSVISAIVQVERYTEAEKLYRRIKREGGQANRATYIVMVRSFIKRNMTREGHKIFNALRKAPVDMTETAYGAGFTLYVDGTWYRHAAVLLKEIEEKCVELDAESQSVLIRSFGILGNKLTPLAEAVQESNLEICKLLSSIFIDKSVQEDETLATLKSFLQKFSDPREKNTICNAFLDCFWRKGDKGLARRISKELLELQFNHLELVLDVRGLSVGGAFISISDWLIKMTNKDVADGSKMTLITGNDFKLDTIQDNRYLRRAIDVTLRQLASPFVETPEDSKQLEAQVADVLEWISQEKVKDAFALY